MSLIGLVLVRTFKVPVSKVVSEVQSQTKIKLRIYKALIRPIVWHGNEAFQRKVLRKICGTVWLMDSGETGVIMKYVNCTRKWS
jgi:hypothetical protein